MIIEIKIEERQVELILKDKKNVLDSYKFEEEYQLSEKLLPNIDKLLKKNKLKVSDIQKMTVKSDIGDNFTTYRIARAVSDSFNFARKFK